MSRPILVGFDPRTVDYAPVELGAELARLTHARLVVASVQGGAPLLGVSTPQNDIDYAVSQVDPDLLPDCTPALENVEPRLTALGIDFECRPLQSTSAARALQSEAERDDAALLVVGSARHRGVGSTAVRVLHGSPCPVAMAPRDWKAEDWTGSRGARTIGVAYVESDEGREALQGGYALAARLGARLRVVTVVRETLRMGLESEPRYVAGQFGKDVDDVEGEYMLMTERRLREAVERLGDGVHADVEVLAGDPAELLVDLSRQLDLLVAGSRGYGPVRGVLLGSVSRRLVAEAQCPTVLLPRGVKAPLEALFESGAAARA